MAVNDRKVDGPKAKHPVAIVQAMSDPEAYERAASRRRVENRLEAPGLNIIPKDNEGANSRAKQALNWAPKAQQPDMPRLETTSTTPACSAHNGTVNIKPSIGAAPEHGHSRLGVRSPKCLITTKTSRPSLIIMEAT